MHISIRIAPALVLWTLAACSSGGSDDADGPIPGGAPNVLLITLDTTRADHLGCYGHAGARTPRIDALAEAGVRFERAYSQVPLTLASHASMLSGVHPSGTGLHVNFQGAIANEVRLLPEVFRASGFRTGAFIAAWVLNSEFGLSRGFDHYDDLSDQRDQRDQQVERSADVIVDRALAWLKQDPKQPFFGWLHFFDAHDPYEPPAGYDEGFDHDYDGELAFIDAQLGRVFDWLNQAGLTDDTLVVITGDHGESLGEHGEGTHGLLIYDWAMRVPLIVFDPRNSANARVVSDPVGLVDLHTTMVELCGGTVDWGVEGGSLLPAVRGEAFESRPIYSESEYALRSFGWAPLHSLVHGDWKYIEAPEPELFNVVLDPQELDNRAQHEPRVLAEMRAALAEHRSAQSVRDVEDLQLASGDVEALSALGYMDGAVDIDTNVDISELKNPMRMTHIVRGVMRAKHLVESENYAAAVATIAPMVAESPESDEIWSLYAEALLETKQYAQAVEAARKSMRVQPEHPGRLVILGDALMRDGKMGEARSVLERALKADPNNVQGHSRKGVLHASAKEWPLAQQHFQRMVELEPDSANARTNLANVLFATGRFDDGLRELDAALRHEANCAPAHLGRIRALAASGRGDQIPAAVRNALQALPTDANFARTLLQLIRQMQAAELVQTIEDHLRQLGG
ncbi:MAG: arylsulfatase A-like enzyme/cytochrome c-type biogenesis protein CcmH/NrfG [Planctomycetota bacterium]|jgi:arylsulfatase A-like enzyme/cytochrome c-type biogenesis protein CcmH/NrfG